eukprot:TRINITY_DN13672_c0_g1_i1.p1 TRINITY_DN13672_c0_g1~~TRINITY_DN13672_c0_g1_i1.p1  ORF type:complete len:242 (-),score=79.79 TRINITY_DN13672_c0_g1_i1:53-748(-)
MDNNSNNDSEEIKYVLFDGGGVLFNGVPGEMLLELRNQPKYQSLDVQEAASLIKNTWKKFKTDDTFTEEEYWAELRQKCNLDEDVDTLKVLVRKSMKTFPDLIEIAKQVKATTFSEGNNRGVGIISNHSISWFGEYAKIGDIYSTFDKNVVIISQEVGVAKPDSNIFQIALDNINKVASYQVEPKNVLFFDDKHKNVEAARSFGFKSEIFDNNSDNAEKLKFLLSDHNVNV